MYLTEPKGCQFVTPSHVITAHTPGTGWGPGQARGEDPAGVGIQGILREGVENTTPTTGCQGVAVKGEGAHPPGPLVDVVDVPLVLAGHKARQADHDCTGGTCGDREGGEERGQI